MDSTERSDMRKTDPIPSLSIRECLCILALACLLFSGSGCILLSHPRLWSPDVKKEYDKELTQELPGRIALIPFYTEAEYFYGPDAWSRHHVETPGLFYVYSGLQLITLGLVFPYSENLFLKWDINESMPPFLLELDSYALYGLSHELNRRGLETAILDPDDFFGLKPKEILRELNKDEEEYDGLLIVRISYKRRIKDGFKYHLKSALFNHKCDAIYRYYFSYRTKDFELWENASGKKFDDGILDHADCTLIMNEARALLKDDFSLFLEKFYKTYKSGKE